MFYLLEDSDVVVKGKEMRDLFIKQFNAHAESEYDYIDDSQFRPLTKKIFETKEDIEKLFSKRG